MTLTATVTAQKYVVATTAPEHVKLAAAQPDCTASRPLLSVLGYRIHVAWLRQGGVSVPAASRRFPCPPLPVS